MEQIIKKTKAKLSSKAEPIDQERPLQKQQYMDSLKIFVS
jgi:hypothetical protein